jgi:hypothetical protein
MKTKKLLAVKAIEMRLQNPNLPPFTVDDFEYEDQYYLYQYFILKKLAESMPKLLEIKANSCLNKILSFKLRAPLGIFCAMMGDEMEEIANKIIGDEMSESEKYVRKLELIVNALKSGL